MSEATHESDFKWLYRAGAFAIFAAVLIFRRFYGVELVTFQGFGIFSVPEAEPVSAVEWFGVLRDTPYAGLCMLGLYDMVNYVLVCIFFLAVGAYLRDGDRGLLNICIAGSVLAAVIYLATNRAFAMLSLSGQYGSAESGSMNEIILAGESYLAVFETGSQTSLLLMYLSGLGISIRMLESEHFRKTAAYAGVAANSIGLLYYPMLVLLPVWNWLPPAFSAPFCMVWYILSGFGLLKLAGGGSVAGSRGEEGAAESSRE